MSPDLRATVIKLDAGLRMLNTALEHLKRHLESQSETPWKLSEEGWMLTTPDSRKLQLGGAERALLMALAQHPLRQMDRDTLVDAINRTLGTDHYNTAALSVMVSRLRKKASNGDLNLPLHAVRGQGYALSAEIEMPRFEIPRVEIPHSPDPDARVSSNSSKASKSR